MDNRERANRFHLARIGLNKHGEETKTKVYELTGVPASAIVAYENPESTRSLNVKNVQKLADHYGVNSAWLLGQSESWSLEGDIRQISESTGLTPEAIWALQKLTKNETQRSFVNALLVSEEFSRIIKSFPYIKRSTDPKPDSTIVDYSSIMNQTDGESSPEFKESDYLDMKLWKASRDLETVLKRLIT